MLNTSESTESKTWPDEDRVGVDGSKKIECDGNRSRNNGNEVDGGEVEDNEVGKSVQNSSKSKKTVRSSDFLTPGAKLAFTKLK